MRDPLHWSTAMLAEALTNPPGQHVEPAIRSAAAERLRFLEKKACACRRDEDSRIVSGCLAHEDWRDKDRSRKPRHSARKSMAAASITLIAVIVGMLAALVGIANL